jgi:hypothetical protein
VSRDIWIIGGIVLVGGGVIYLATREPTPSYSTGTMPTPTVQQPQTGELQQALAGLGQAAASIFGEVRSQSRADQQAALDRRLAKDRELASNQGGGASRSQS